MVLQTATTLPTEPISIPILQLKGSSMPLGHQVSFEYTDSVPFFDRSETIYFFLVKFGWLKEIWKLLSNLKYNWKLRNRSPVIVIKSIMLSRWPYFHNGVAAGLRLSASSAEDIDSSWIMFNKQNAGDNRDKVNLAF